MRENPTIGPVLPRQQSRQQELDPDRYIESPEHETRLRRHVSVVKGKGIWVRQPVLDYGHISAVAGITIDVRRSRIEPGAGAVAAMYRYSQGLAEQQAQARVTSRALDAWICPESRGKREVA